MSGKRPNDPSGVTATNVQVYVPAIIALLLGIISIIVGIFLLMPINNLGTYSKLVRKFSSANGLKGSISGFALTIGTPTTGVLKGPGLQAATDADITQNYTLQGFNNTNPGTIIGASDSILDASQKLTLFNYSPLTSLASARGPITANDSVFEAASRIKGQIDNWRQKFAVTGLINYPPSDFVLLTQNFIGNNVINANTIMPGLTYTILTQGSVKAIGAMGPLNETLEFQLRLNDTLFTSILTIPRNDYSTTVSWPFTLSFNLSFISTILVSLTSTLVVYKPITGGASVNLTSKTSVVQTMPYVGSIGNAINVYGRTNDSTGTGHVTSILTYIIENIACFPTVGVMHS